MDGYQGNPGRTIGIITLVVSAVLGATFLIGRALVPDPPQPSAITVTGADQPAPATAEPSSSQVPGAAESNPPDGQVDDPDIGPMGTRTTTGTAEVALTFDDGPHPDYTPQILAILREYQVTATFCVVGQNAEAYPWLIQQIVAEGHTLCNHSWDHDTLLGTRSPDWIRSDLQRTSAAIRAAVPDAPIAWYRQPGGAWTYPVVAVAGELGMASLHWTLDTSDWQAPGATLIAGSILDGVRPGSIILLHDAGGDRQGTVNAMYQVLPELASRFDVRALPRQGM